MHESGSVFHSPQACVSNASAHASAREGSNLSAPAATWLGQVIGPHQVASK